MVFNLKPRKPIMFTANAHKNAQGYSQTNKDSMCYNQPLYTDDEDHFHHPQILILESDPHTNWILNRDKKNTILSKVVTNTKYKSSKCFTLYTSNRFKNRNICFNSKLHYTKRNFQKLQPLRKGPYQIIDKPTDVTYKLTNSSKKEIFQHLNILLNYYPKEYALRELTQ